MKKRVKFPLGDFLKDLREKKGVSLRDVENATEIPNAYLSQLENGDRQKIPTPDRMKKLADYYNVTIQELLEKAGYFNQDEIGETYEETIEKVFKHVVSDPLFKYGARMKGKYDLDAKRFIIEMYEKVTGKKII